LPLSLRLRPIDRSILRPLLNDSIPLLVRFPRLIATRFMPLRLSAIMLNVITSLLSTLSWLVAPLVPMGSLVLRLTPLLRLRLLRLRLLRGNLLRLLRSRITLLTGGSLPCGRRSWWLRDILRLRLRRRHDLNRLRFRV